MAWSAGELSVVALGINTDDRTTGRSTGSPGGICEMSAGGIAAGTVSGSTGGVCVVGCRVSVGGGVYIELETPIVR